MFCLQVTEVSQRNSGGSGQANGTSSSPSSGVSSQVTSSNGSTAAATSVKAALAAIQAGQLSLNQVAALQYSHLYCYWACNSILISRTSCDTSVSKVGYYRLCWIPGAAEFFPSPLCLDQLQCTAGGPSLEVD
jgi:hypothetical protein